MSAQRVVWVAERLYYGEWVMDQSFSSRATAENWLRHTNKTVWRVVPYFPRPEPAAPVKETP